MGTKPLRTAAIAGLGLALGLAFAAAPAAGASTLSQPSNARLHMTSHTKSVLQSSNWSGYAKTGSGFTSAKATWTVPTVTVTSGNRYSSDWVGIDGFSNSNLIQTGTEQDSINGAAHYNAWWEILPAPETPISMTVRPGNSMTATITKGSSGWTISIKNNSTGASFSTTRSYSGPGTSVEYIQEAPEVNGTIAKPAKISKVTFASLLENGVNPNLTSSEEIELVQGSTVYYTPSAPSGGNSFSDSYTGP